MKIKKELIMRDIAGDIILVPVGKSVLEHNGLFVLNEISGEIWKLLTEGKEPGQIVSALAEAYDAPLETIRADVEEFLAELVKCDILEM